MAAKTCEICNNRPVMTAKQAREAGVNFPYCRPCLTEAEWENHHSDHGHEDEDAVAKGYVEQADLDECWICHPELNQASADYVQRTGTSRAGMKLTVPIKADGRTKAKVVAAKMEDSYATSIQVRKGVVTLKAASALGQGFRLTWDVQGRFTGGTVAENGKTRQVRNAAEALRLSA